MITRRSSKKWLRKKGESMPPKKSNRFVQRVMREELKRAPKSSTEPKWGGFSPQAIQRIEFFAARLALRDAKLNTLETRELVALLAQQTKDFAETHNDRARARVQATVEEITELERMATGQSSFEVALKRRVIEISALVREAIRKEIEKTEGKKNGLV